MERYDKTSLLEMLCDRADECMKKKGINYHSQCKCWSHCELLEVISQVRREHVAETNKSIESWSKK